MAGGPAFTLVAMTDAGSAHEALRADMATLRDHALAAYRDDIRDDPMCTAGFVAFMADAGLAWVDALRRDAITTEGQPPVTLPPHLDPPGGDAGGDAVTAHAEALGAHRAAIRALVIERAAPGIVSREVRNTALEAAGLGVPELVEHVTVTVTVTYGQYPGTGVAAGTTEAEAAHAVTKALGALVPGALVTTATVTGYREV